METKIMISANDDSMVEVYSWIDELKQILRGLDQKEQQITNEKAQHIRTLRWLQTLDLMND